MVVGIMKAGHTLCCASFTGVPGRETASGAASAAAFPGLRSNCSQGRSLELASQQLQAIHHFYLAPCLSLTSISMPRTVDLPTYYIHDHTVSMSRKCGKGSHFDERQQSASGGFAKVVEGGLPSGRRLSGARE